MLCRPHGMLVRVVVVLESLAPAAPLAMHPLVAELARLEAPVDGLAVEAAERALTSAKDALPLAVSKVVRDAPTDSAAAVHGELHLLHDQEEGPGCLLVDRVHGQPAGEAILERVALDGTMVRYEEFVGVAEPEGAVADEPALDRKDDLLQVVTVAEAFVADLAKANMVVLTGQEVHLRETPAPNERRHADGANLPPTIHTGESPAVPEAVGVNGKNRRWKHYVTQIEARGERTLPKVEQVLRQLDALDSRVLKGVRKDVGDAVVHDDFPGLRTLECILSNHFDVRLYTNCLHTVCFETIETTLTNTREFFRNGKHAWLGNGDRQTDGIQGDENSLGGCSSSRVRHLHGQFVSSV